jgi:hypothetical protein
MINQDTYNYSILNRKIYEEDYTNTLIKENILTQINNIKKVMIE